MNRLQAWSVHLSTLLVGGTGLIYAWMRYVSVPTDPYSVVNHPLQPVMQHLHLLVAPLLVFAVGLIWHEHVWKHWRSGMPGRRVSGLVLMITLVPMTMSGYLIQTAVDPTWRKIWVGVHLVTAALWTLSYVGHQVRSLVAHRRRRARSKGRSEGTRRPILTPSLDPGDGVSARNAGGISK